MNKILLVEDSLAFRTPLAAALQRRGYLVRDAVDGIRALSVLENWKPDLVVMDLNMPAMGGMTVLRAMRSKPGLADLPVIILTGSSDYDVLAEAARLGAHCLLKYCVTLRELCGLIEQRIHPNTACVSV